MDCRSWIVFSYGQAAFTGSRKAANSVDTLHVWRVTGDLAQTSQMVTERRRVQGVTGMRIEEIQVSQVSKRWRATGPKEKLFVGWAGWADLKLNIGDTQCERGIFAEKGGKSCPEWTVRNQTPCYCTATYQSGQVNGCDVV